ncbi:SH3 domain-containing protein [Nocardioides glacieisoli]|uniref:SH3 domain-containing protein n=1 Tax=Nocardioides glacieisoli TaxID=1168730 RepID=A0A4Q2RLQ9_9ACTN|nr:SH3 domain-containing protein [Nocardioides glacieisoli]RYB89637.1 SH3 domain-containing protein [Nocardioides glacieisoli]
MSAPLAVVATLSAVTMGVLAAEPATSDDNLLASSGTLSSGTQSLSGAASSTLSRRGDIVSRSTIRTAAKAESAARQDLEVDQQARRLAKKLDRSVWTTEVLNLWSGPSEKSDKLGEIGALKQVVVTGREQMGRTQVVLDGQSRWVSSDYLAREKPEPEPEEPAVPALGGSCTNGTTAGGAGVNIQKVHAAVCANWPSIATYGTLRGGGGDHPLGRAVDIMVSGSTGWAVAEFVRANAAALGVSYVIHAQNIWSVQRSAEGWRSMADRGSVTANHYDHVHVSTY